MARPRKGTEETWYDTFSEWDEADRTAALKVLMHLHRALSRKDRTEEVADADAVPLVVEPAGASV